MGAPKCGTTSLYAYLKQHPDVFMPAKKELRYFAKDLHPDRFKDDADYLLSFAEAKEEKRVGEASPWYLYSQVAAEQIKAFNPEARIIAMLRNPVDMMYSLHAQIRYNGWEDEADFTRAMALEEERKRGLSLPRNADLYAVKILFYRETGKYTDQLKRYIDAFGRDRVHVIIFDDFKNDTSRIFSETCQFLDVDSSFEPEFTIANPNTVRRSQFLKTFLASSAARPVQRLARVLLPQAKWRQSVRLGVEQINTKVEKRGPMDSTLRRSLQLEFEPEVERLSQLLGRDLTALWSRDSVMG